MSSPITTRPGSFCDSWKKALTSLTGAASGTLTTSAVATGTKHTAAPSEAPQAAGNKAAFRMNTEDHHGSQLALRFWKSTNTTAADAYVWGVSRDVDGTSYQKTLMLKLTLAPAASGLDVDAGEATTGQWVDDITVDHDGTQTVGGARVKEESAGGSVAEIAFDAFGHEWVEVEMEQYLNCEARRV